MPDFRAARRSSPTPRLHKAAPVALPLLLASLLLGGCASWFSGTDNREPPRELKELTAALPVNTFWEVQLGAAEDSGTKLRPAIADGRIYASSAAGNVVALDANSGTRVWEIDLETTITGGVGVGGGLVVVSSADGNVIALAVEDGKERWRNALRAEVLAPVAVSDDRVIVRSADGRLRGLDPRTGGELWQFDRNVPTLSLRGNAPPVAANGLVVNASDGGRLTVLNAESGVALWERSIASPRGASELDRLVDLDADPIIDNNLIYISGVNGRLAALELRSGRVRWAKPFSTFAGIAVSPQRLVGVEDNGDISVFDRRNGNHLWKQDDLHERAVGSPGIQGQHAIVGDGQGFLHWINLESGLVEARTRIDQTPIRTAPLIEQSVAYVQTSGGKLAAVGLR